MIAVSNIPTVQRAITIKTQTELGTTITNTEYSTLTIFLPVGLVTTKTLTTPTIIITRTENSVTTCLPVLYIVSAVVVMKYIIIR
jgi:hypothetical protein